MWDLLESKLDIDAQSLRGCTVRSGDLDPVKNSVVIPSETLLLQKYAKKLFSQLLDTPGISAADVGRLIKVNTDGSGLTLSPYKVESSLSASGYIRFHNGLILQWGYSSKTTESDHTKTGFPVIFPHTCLSAVITPKLSASSSTSDWNASIMSIDASGIVIMINNTGSSTYAEGVRFLAIGY